MIWVHWPYSDMVLTSSANIWVDKISNCFMRSLNFIISDARHCHHGDAFPHELEPHSVAHGVNEAGASSECACCSLPIVSQPLALN